MDSFKIARITLLLVLCVLLLASSAWAADVKFQWDPPSSGSPPIGYVLKYSLAQDLTNPVPMDVGANLTGTLTLPAGTYWVFATAYNRILVDGKPTGPLQESAHSNVLKLEIVLPPGAPGNLKLGTIVLAWSPPAKQTARISLTGR